MLCFRLFFGQWTDIYRCIRSKQYSRGRFSFQAVIQIIFGTVYLIMDYSNKINLSIPHNFLNVLLSKYFNNIRVYVSRFDLMWCGEGGSKISWHCAAVWNRTSLPVSSYIYEFPCAVCIHVYMHIYIQPISVLFTRATRAICPDKGGILPPLSALSALPPSSSPPGRHSQNIEQTLFKTYASQHC